MNHRIGSSLVSSYLVSKCSLWGPKQFCQYSLFQLLSSLQLDIVKGFLYWGSCWSQNLLWWKKFRNGSHIQCPTVEKVFVLISVLGIDWNQPIACICGLFGSFLIKQHPPKINQFIIISRKLNLLPKVADILFCISVFPVGFSFPFISEDMQSAHAASL